MRMMVHGSGALATGSDADSVYVLQRVPVVAGSDFRSADPGTNRERPARCAVHADQRSRRPVLRLHQQERRPEHGRGDGRPRTRSGQHQERDSRLAARSKAASRRTKSTVLSKMLRTGALPASLNYLEDRTVGASLGADSIQRGRDGGHRGRAGGHGLHADLLPRLGHQRRSGAVPEPGDPAGLHGLLRTPR